MAPKRRKRFRLPAALLFALFFGGLAWYACTRIQRLELNRLLMEAVKEDNMAAVRSLLRSGADPNARDRAEERRTSLLDLLQSLLRRDVSVHDEQYSTALMWAAVRGNTAGVRALLDAGADVNAKKRDAALVLGSFNGSTSTIGEMRSLANRTTGHNGGETALMCAAVYGEPAMITDLLNRGADIHAKDMLGQTALDLAIAAGRSGTIISLLREAGAKE